MEYVFLRRGLGDRRQTAWRTASYVIWLTARTGGLCKFSHRRSDWRSAAKFIAKGGFEMPKHGPVHFAFAASIVAGALGVSSARAEDSIVKLVSVSSGMCLQPIKGSTVQGDAIVQQPCDGSVAQQWTVHLVSSTKVHLINRLSNLCLDGRGKAVNGTPIQQWTCNGITNENWSFGITNNLLSSGISNTFSHCVATPGAQAGLPMSLRFCDGDASQLWNRPSG